MHVPLSRPTLSQVAVSLLIALSRVARRAGPHSARSRPAHPLHGIHPGRRGPRPYLRGSHPLPEHYPPRLGSADGPGGRPHPRLTARPAGPGPPGHRALCRRQSAGRPRRAPRRRRGLTGPAHQRGRLLRRRRRDDPVDPAPVGRAPPEGGRRVAGSGRAPRLGSGRRHVDSGQRRLGSGVGRRSHGGRRHVRGRSAHDPVKQPLAGRGKPGVDRPGLIQSTGSSYPAFCEPWSKCRAPTRSVAVRESI